MGTVITMALLIVLAGFFPALAAAMGVYAVIRDETLLPVEMSGARIAAVFAATLARQRPRLCSPSAVCGVPIQRIYLDDRNAAPWTRAAICRVCSARVAKFAGEQAASAPLERWHRLCRAADADAARRSSTPRSKSSACSTAISSTRQQVPVCDERVCGSSTMMGHVPQRVGHDEC